MHFLKKGQKIQAWVDPPSLIRAMPERKRFFPLMSSLTGKHVHEVIWSYPGCCRRKWSGGLGAAAK